MKKLISTLPPLRPIQTINLVTGEVEEAWNEPVDVLLDYVQAEVESLYETQSNKLFTDFEEADNHVGSANSFARQRGYQSDYKTLPSGVLAKSRVNELILHKFVSETFAYHQSTNRYKKAPSFQKKVNLGAADKQMNTLSYVDGVLWLEWKVWDKHLLFEFNVPDYVLKRDIRKWSLPTVQYSKKTGEIVFYFSIQENPKNLPKNRITAGVDLGRAVPFTLAILDESNGRIIKKVTTPGRLKQLNARRERLIVQKKQVLAKLNHYKQLGFNPNKQGILQQEANRLRSKTRRLGASLAQQSGGNLTKTLTKYNVTTLHLENLNFVHGKKYGSKWNHSAQQDAIIHATTRAGVKSIKVNPAGSSQHCHACKKKITHNTKHRTVHCSDCRTTLDRDFNAALNILKKQSYPRSHSKPGDNYSPLGQVMKLPVSGASRSQPSAPL